MSEEEKIPPQPKKSMEPEFVYHNGSDAAKLLIELGKDSEQYDGVVVLAVQKRPRLLKCIRLGVELARTVLYLEQAKLALLEGDDGEET